MKGKMKGPLHQKTRRNFYVGRIFASISILVALLVVCMWVPLAIATDQESGTTPTLAQEPVAAADTAEAAPGSDTAVAETSTVADETVTGAAESASTDNSTAADAEKSQVSESAVDATATTGAITEAALAVYEPAPVAAPDLDLICGTPYWANGRADYNQYLLAIDYELHNYGPGTAYNVMVVSATGTNGVNAAWFSSLMNWQEIAANSSVYFTIKWLLPTLEPGFGFVTNLEICEGCCCDDDKDDDDSGEDQYGDDEDDEDDSGEDQYGDEDNKDEDDSGEDQYIDPGDDDNNITPNGNNTNNGSGDPAAGDPNSNLSLSSLPVTGIGFIVIAIFGLIMIAAGAMIPASGRVKR